MAVYIYLRIVHHKTPKVAHFCLWTSTVFCYTMPLFITLWELLTRRLGYTTSATEGWCGPKYIDEAGRRSILLAFIGYDMWLFLTYIIVPILYVSVLLFLRQQVSRYKPNIMYTRDPIYCTSRLVALYTAETPTCIKTPETNTHDDTLYIVVVTGLGPSCNECA